MNKKTFALFAFVVFSTSVSGQAFSQDAPNALVDGVIRGLGQLINSNKSSQESNSQDPNTNVNVAQTNGKNGSEKYRWQDKNINETDLVGFFDKFPNKGNRMALDWPRIAMTIDDVSYGLVKRLPGYYQRSADDQRSCIEYSLTVWMSPKKSKKYDNLQTCVEDVPDGTNLQLTSWTYLYYMNNHTGNARTSGPNPPSTPYPNKKANDSLSPIIVDGGVCAGSMFGKQTNCGAMLLSHVFNQLSYNGRVDSDDMRMWVVSVNWKKD